LEGGEWHSVNDMTYPNTKSLSVRRFGAHLEQYYSTALRRVPIQLVEWGPGRVPIQLVEWGPGLRSETPAANSFCDWVYSEPLARQGILCELGIVPLSKKINATKNMDKYYVMQGQI
jgi:hypothetical protein